MGRSCQPQLSRRPWLFPWPWLFCLVAGPAVMAAAVGAASVAGLAVPAAAGGAATVAGPVPTAADVGTATVADLVEVTAAAAGLAVTGSMPVVWPDLFVPKSQQEHVSVDLRRPQSRVIVLGTYTATYASPVWPWPPILSSANTLSHGGRNTAIQ